MFQPVVGMMTPTVAIILLVIALVVFGPGKIPELGKGLGKSIRDFRAATEDMDVPAEK